MESASHTPGPWEAHDHVVFSSPDDTVAICNGEIMVRSDEDWQRRKANARLIAAAPDMLAALKDAANRLRGAGMLSDTDEILTAIAKAEGRS